MSLSGAFNRVCASATASARMRAPFNAVIRPANRTVGTVVSIRALATPHGENNGIAVTRSSATPLRWYSSAMCALATTMAA